MNLFGVLSRVVAWACACVCALCTSSYTQYYVWHFCGFNGCGGVFDRDGGVIELYDYDGQLVTKRSRHTLASG